MLNLSRSILIKNSMIAWHQASRGDQAEKKSTSKTIYEILFASEKGFADGSVNRRTSMLPRP